MSKKSSIRPKSKPSSPLSTLTRHLTVERVIVGGSLLSTLLIFAVLALNSYLNRPIDIDGVERFNVSQQHSEGPVTYAQLPPAGGPHNPIWQNCGVYFQPIRTESAVHSQEHGAVWITYDPNLPASEVETLRNITRQGSHRLLSPFPGSPSPIVASAWGYQLQLEQADDWRLGQFLRQYEQGPTAPEPRAVCTRGESRTLAELQ